MSTQLEGKINKPNKKKKYNYFQIFGAEVAMYFIILMVLEGYKVSIQDAIGASILLALFIRWFLFYFINKGNDKKQN
jgi:hypothetical protein